MLEHGRLRRVATNDLLSVHGPILGTAGSSDDIGEARVCVHQGSLDLERRRLIHTVAMNDVGNFKPGETDLPDSLEFVVDLVILKALFAADVREDAIALPFFHVERFAVPRVDEPVDVRLELLRHLRRERLSLACSHWFLLSAERRSSRACVFARRVGLVGLSRRSCLKSCFCGLQRTSKQRVIGLTLSYPDVVIDDWKAHVSVLRKLTKLVNGKRLLGVDKRLAFRCATNNPLKHSMKLLEALVPIFLATSIDVLPRREEECDYAPDCCAIRQKVTHIFLLLLAAQPV